MAERRWIVIADDGSYVTLGRHSDPSSDEIAAAEASLLAASRSGWLAIMEGNPYARRMPKLMMVRPLAAPTATFADALNAFSIQYP